MATSQDYLNAVGAYNPGVDLSSVLGGHAQQAAASGQDINSFVSQYQASPDILQAYNKQQQDLYAPQVNQINSQIGLAQNQTALQQSLVGQQYDNSAYGLRQTQNQDVAGAMQQAYSAGINRSSFAPTATARIGANTQQALSYNEAQRANSLSSLALQGQSNVGQLQGSLAQIQAQEGSAATTNYLQANQQQQKNQLDTYAAIKEPNLLLLSTSPAYASAYAQLLAKAGLGTANISDIMSQASAAYKQAGGAASGTAPPAGTVSAAKPAATVSAPAPVTYKAGAINSASPAAQWLTAQFKSGAGFGNDQSDIQHLAQTFGMAPDAASYYFYHIRKPYEK